VLIDFGDGRTQTLGGVTGPVGVTHTYNREGGYTVTATATDINRQRCVSSIAIVVAPAPLPAVTLSATPNPITLAGNGFTTFTVGATVLSGGSPIRSVIVRLSSGTVIYSGTGGGTFTYQFGTFPGGSTNTVTATATDTAGNISAHWMGYCEYAEHGIVNNRPVMVGYQAAGSAPFIAGKMIDNPETIATAIRIGHPQSWDKAWVVQKDSKGWFGSQTDEELLAAQKLLAMKEGIFCEPASAISLAGLLHDIRKGKIPEGSRVVCTLTGHGLKDPDTAIKQSTTPLIKVKAGLGEVKKAILDNMAK